MFGRGLKPVETFGTLDAMSRELATQRARLNALEASLGLLDAGVASLASGLAALAAASRDCACATASPAPARGDAGTGPVIQIRTMGNLANRMIQYMAGLALQRRMPGARLTGIDLPEWDIVSPQVELAEPILRLPSHAIDVERVLALVPDGGFDHVILLQYLQNVANLLPAAEYRACFRARVEPAHRFDDGTIVISLRMAEVLSGFYPFYTLLPIGFYRDMVAATGLEPVFFGQLTPSPYLDALRDAFPQARFIEGTGAMADFEVLRAAPNLCLSVSTFAWAAGYLGDAQRIVMPVTGLLHPAATASFGEDIDLVPRDDPRYEHWIFPVNYAVPGERSLDVLARLEGRWRRVAPDEARAILDGERRAARDIADTLALFDPGFYLASHPEVAAAVADRRMASAEAHYRLHGFQENRPCFALDRAWYAETHLDAATEVGFGRYRDLHHFHAARGHALGYAALPGADGAREGRQAA